MYAHVHIWLPFIPCHGGQVVGSFVRRRDFSRSPRPHDDVTSIDLNGPTRCTRESGEGVRPSVPTYTGETYRLFSSSLVLWGVSRAVDRVLFEPRNGRAISQALRIGCINRLISLKRPVQFRFQCMLGTSEFIWKILN